MNFHSLNIFKTSKSPRVAKLPRIENIKFDFIGKYNGNICERLIAGEKIPDSQRKAYRKGSHYPDIDYPPIPNFYSGSLGFLDFQINVAENNFHSYLYVAFLGVEPEFSRRGVGSSLMKKVEEDALLQNVSRIWLYIDRDKYEMLEPFYTSLGYEGFDGKMFSKYLN